MCLSIFFNRRLWPMLCQHIKPGRARWLHSWVFGPGLGSLGRGSFCANFLQCLATMIKETKKKGIKPERKVNYQLIKV